MVVIPSTSNPSQTAAEISWSSEGSLRSARWTIVTCDPNRRNIWANSQPIHPPPTTIRWAGSPAQPLAFDKGNTSVPGRPKGQRKTSHAASDDRRVEALGHVLTLREMSWRS